MVLKLVVFPSDALETYYKKGEIKERYFNPNNYFTRKLYITVGSLDNNGSDSSLRHNTESDLQGLNRLARANYFFSKSRTYAISVGATFNWQFHTVTNSGHDAVQMSNDAVNLLY
jgi:hypothetical protein